jgi:hypothetical protein
MLKNPKDHSVIDHPHTREREHKNIHQIKAPKKSYLLIKYNKINTIDVLI